MKKLGPNDLWLKIVAGASEGASEAADDTICACPGGHPQYADEEVENSNNDSAEVCPSAPAETLLPAVATSGPPAIVPQRFPNNLPGLLDLVQGQDGRTYSIRHDRGNLYVLPVGSRAHNNIIREIAQQEGITLRSADLRDINAHLQAYAEMAGLTREVWNRVAPADGGVEIDLASDSDIRVRITPGNVEILKSRSETLFVRSPSSLPMATPADNGNLNLLNKYLRNLHEVLATLLIAWIVFTMALPKRATSKFIHLLLIGNKGSGKTSLCVNILSKLMGPTRVVLRAMPSNGKDLAIALQSSHVVFIDNVRGFHQSMADLMCIASTGGAIASRKLYTDEDEHVINLHGPLVLTSVHPLIDQPDLADRFLPIETRPIPGDKRKSDTELAREFEADLPYILRGLFDLLAEILVHLPTVIVEAPERMVDFVRFLAAMEKALDMPAGALQQNYRDIINQGQRDALLENVLAAAVIELVESTRGGDWSGTPKELLVSLNGIVSKGTQRSREWPQNPIAMTKRLRALEAGLKSQKIGLEFGRNHQRYITITYEGE